MCFVSRGLNLSSWRRGICTSDLWPITGGDEKEVAPPILQPEEEEPVAPTEPPPQPDQTTLVHNEEEAFALEPLDVTSVPGKNKFKKRRDRTFVKLLSVNHVKKGMG